MTEPTPEETVVYEELPENLHFSTSLTKFNSEGYWVMSDFANRATGDAYEGMPASASQVKTEPLDENGEPVEGSTSILDNPGSMTQIHTAQRFPVGTRTAVRYKMAGQGSNDWTYTMWEYKRASYFDRKKRRFVPAYRFVEAAKYSTSSPARGRGRGLPSPTSEVKSLVDNGGYWYRGKKYP